MRTLPLFCLLLLCCSLPTVASALTVTSISPAVAYADSTRTYDVYGTGFAIGAQVTLTPAAGGTAIQATGEDWVDFTHLRCTVTIPPGPVTGLYTATVSNPRDPGSGSMANAFTVFARPAITSISTPSGAPGAIVTNIDIGGTNFVSGVRFRFQGGTGGTTTFESQGEIFISSTRMRCTVAIPLNAYPGSYDVDVAIPGLDYVPGKADAFSVIAPTPTITGLTPASAEVGETPIVDVYGTGFANGAEIIVQGGPSGDPTIIYGTGEAFGGPNRVQCILPIPSDAYIGSYTAYIRNVGGDWVYKSNAFAVTAPIPTVTGISPDSAALGESVTRVYVTGTGFTSGAEVALYGGPTLSTPVYAETETWVNSTTIRCNLVIPPDAPPGTYRLGVRNPGTGWSYTYNAFTVTVPQPTVTGISPNNAAPGETLFPVYVFGTGFINGTIVELIGGTGGLMAIGAADETWVNSTTIRCTLPIPDTAYPGHYSLHVYNPTGISPSFKEDAVSDAFTVTAPTPAVTGLSPNSALVGTWISTLNVSGTGFANGANVAIGNNSTWIYATGATFINATRIQCSLFIPADAYIGSYTVWVRNIGGQWVYRSNAFTVVAPVPTVTAISPASAYPGDTLADVTVTGTGFANGAGIRIRADIGGTVIDATGETFLSPTEIRCTLAIPVDAHPSRYRVAVTNPGDSSPSSSRLLFRVLTRTPTVAEISPASAAPGDVIETVYVSGSNFTAGAWVTIHGGTGGTTTISGTSQTFISPDQIRCRLAIPPDAYPGPYTVTVTNPTGIPETEAPSASKAGAFTVTAPTPSLTGIVPGSATPGQTLETVYVTGSRFVNGAQIQLSGGPGYAYHIHATDETWINATTLRCRIAAPADAYPGPYDVYIRNPPDFEISAGLSDAFTVTVPTPTVRGIVPSTANPGQTLTTVNVTGTGFATGANVILRRAGSADIQATGELVAPPSLITCRLAVPPDAATGSWNVVVTNLGGPSGTLTGGFTITPNVDTTPPASVTDLRPLGWNATSITWVWTDPPDADFARVRVYQDGAFRADVDRDVQTYTLTGLAPITGYRLGTRTCDLAGNFNATLVSNWATTAPRPVGPVADFTANATSGPAPLAVRFTDASTGTPISWSWTFGDGGTSTLRDPSHTYTSAGTYTVTLDVSNGDGSDSEVKTGFITVTALPGVVMVPGGSGIPTDTGGDGVYEDVNGNGRADFADVVLYFNEMAFITTNEPLSAFDFNRNGRIDFADIVWLFNHL